MGQVYSRTADCITMVLLSLKQHGSAVIHITNVWSLCAAAWLRYINWRIPIYLKHEITQATSMIFACICDLVHHACLWHSTTEAMLCNFYKNIHENYLAGDTKICQQHCPNYPLFKNLKWNLSSYGTRGCNGWWRTCIEHLLAWME